MRTTQLPDPNSSNLDSPCDAGYWPSFFAHARSGPVYFREHWGPLSIKCTLFGRERYVTGGETYTVRPDNYLILNTGQRYSSEILPNEEKEKETDSFTVFFRPQLAEEVLSALVTPDDALLDDPGALPGNAVTFFEGLHPHDSVVSPLLRRLCLAGESGIATKGWYEDQFHKLLEAMLKQHRTVVSQIESLPFKRSSTRQEIYRRLTRARDFIDGNYSAELRLRDMAGEAYMAPHHFLRMFHDAFQLTPHQYLTAKRMSAARRMLLGTEMPVSDICMDVGFTSLGSFSSLFSRTVGMSPMHYRKTVGRVFHVK